jgi:hypothetical protein
MAQRRRWDRPAVRFVGEQRWSGWRCTKASIRLVTHCRTCGLGAQNGLQDWVPHCLSDAATASLKQCGTHTSRLSIKNGQRRKHAHPE